LGFDALGLSVEFQKGVKLHKEWIDNDRRMRHLIEQKRQVAAEAGEILAIKEAARTLSGG
jgi:hypothetical protein